MTSFPRAAVQRRFYSICFPIITHYYHRRPHICEFICLVKKKIYIYTYEYITCMFYQSYKIGSEMENYRNQFNDYQRFSKCIHRYMHAFPLTFCLLDSIRSDRRNRHRFVRSIEKKIKSNPRPVYTKSRFRSREKNECRSVILFRMARARVRRGLGYVYTIHRTDYRSGLLFCFSL